MGIKSPAADAMIAALLKAETREDVVAAVRALDRVLMSGSYVVPLVPRAGAVARALGLHRAAGDDLDARLSSPKPGGASRRRNEADVILEDTLGDRGMHDANDLPAVKATLDDLFRRAAGGAGPMRSR